MNQRLDEEERTWEARQPRHCPKCSNTLISKSVNNITYDQCPNCGGLWFDALEDQKLAKEYGIDTGDPDAVSAYDKNRRINCPVCSTQMVSMIDIKHDYHYEKCQVCYGVFYDTGEFADSQKLTAVEIFKLLFD
ncbi:MAG: zf-TFIIB domain-containing protein [Anaerolineae bacterium]|nr:zf-TFIIB domain-containing protein [Anaerolineae bacterium]